MYLKYQFWKKSNANWIEKYPQVLKKIETISGIHRKWHQYKHQKIFLKLENTLT